MMKSRKQAGFSLLEVLVVVAIIGVLASLALTSYQNSVRKARRADAKTVLMETAMFLERNYTEANRYDQDAAGNTIDNNALPNREAPIDGNTKFYDIQFLGTPGTHTFTIQAVPKNTQVKDTLCATLGIDETGAKSVTGSGTVNECWAR